MKRSICTAQRDEVHVTHTRVSETLGMAETVLSLTPRPEELYIDLEAQPDHHVPALLPLGKLQLGHRAALRQERSNEHGKRHCQSNNLRPAEQADRVLGDVPRGSQARLPPVGRDIRSGIR